jgi:hypothetical protein
MPSCPTPSSIRLLLAFALIALPLLAAGPAAADAIQTADAAVNGQKANVKTLMLDVIGIASVVCIGCAAWTLLMDRNTKVIVSGAVGLAVAAIAGAIIATL